MIFIMQKERQNSNVKQLLDMVEQKKHFAGKFQMAPIIPILRIDGSNLMQRHLGVPIYFKKITVRM